MINSLRITVITFLSVALLGSPLAVAGDTFEVTITNLTRGQTFTPVLVASLRNNVRLFKLGEPASDELAALAEGGDTMPLEDLLEAKGRVIEVEVSEGLLLPGESVTVIVEAGGGAKKITLASMLIPTNDSFIALNSVNVPKEGKSRTYWSPAYDAGSEPNDELCANIPGPFCMGNGISEEAGGEGYVHISAGIHGIGDLLPSTYDWRNRVAKITVKHKD